MAIRQSISRADLAKWDASARAWLRRADQSKVQFHGRFTLIMKNVKTPFVDPGSTFEKVKRGWIRAMKVLEDLLQNVPQQVPDRAVLMAISAWHLYPDLSGSHSGIGASRDSKRQLVVRSEEAYQRVSFQDLWVVAVGALLRQWKLPSSSIGPSIIWFKRLGEVLKKSSASSSPEVSWLLHLCEAASSIVDPTATESDPMMLLVQFGWWKATHVFGSGATIQPYFFELCQLNVIRELQRDNDLEIGFQYIRQIGSQLNLRPQDAITVYLDKGEDSTYVEWATLSPPTQTTYDSEESHAKRQKVTHVSSGSTSNTDSGLIDSQGERLIYGIGKFYASADFVVSLRALELATIIYRQLPTSSVSLKVIDMELSKAHWLPDRLKAINNANVDGFQQALCKPIE
ncbi:hypothetical protein QQZ08_008223 [Neonectria magnoliae]|uniref:Uncharacterized protein n=1 Tax=Neonectria magnoliae TaxID=2732573 RepID=A0ABR1HXI8_9HYPO